MATRFMRIDLSEDARDYRPVALEPGVPMLDKSSANAKIVHRWLGGLAAEPVWEGDSIAYFVRDDKGGRLEEAVPEPATNADLQGMLQGDLTALRERLDKAQPETSTERLVKKMLRQSFDDLTAALTRVDLDSYFFKYQDASERWRLVWCWGYQRIDREPADAAICTDDECKLLFVRKPGQSPRCPACEALLSTGKKKRKKKRNKKAIAALLLLLFLLGAGLYWWIYCGKLKAVPGEYAGPVGSRVEFKIVKTGFFADEDVTAQTVGIVLDPAVARYEQMANAARMVGPGKTQVRFQMGELEPIYVAMVVSAAKNPKQLIIRPDKMALAIGSTQRLELIGRMDDGREVDLTLAAEWTAQNDGTIYAYDGLVVGLSEGKSTVAARYRANPDCDYVEAAAGVSVAAVEFQSLEVALEPSPVGVGCASGLRIDGVAADGKKYSLLESWLLDTRIQPDYLASVEGNRLEGRQIGDGKITATFNEDLSAGHSFEVALAPRLEKLFVAPAKLDLVVGQVVELSILSPSSDPIHVVTPDAAICEVDDDDRLIARGEGNVQIGVRQGNRTQTVDVTVSAADFLAVAVDPPRVFVPVDHTVRPRVLARIEGERYVEISPDLLVVEKTPSRRYAAFDAQTTELLGVLPTDPSTPQALRIRLGQHQAAVPVEALLAPFRLRLTPPGPVELPLGQQVRLQGWATYGSGHRVQVLTGRIEYDSQLAEDAAPGLELRGDKVAALKENAGPLSVWGAYFETRSKSVEFRSVQAGDVTLKLQTDRTIRLAGETGRVVLTGSGPGGDVDLVPDLAAYKSSDGEILTVDEKTGAFRAVAPGEVIIEGTHAAAKEPASLRMQVFDPANATLVFEPDSITLNVDEVARLQLFLEVQDGDKVERAALTGPGVGYKLTNPNAVEWLPPMLVALRPADPFEIMASFYPILSDVATARIEILPETEPAAIRIVPSEAKLASGQTHAFKVEQQLPDAPDQWKEVCPDAVSWTVPPRLIWTPPAGDLRAAATIPEDPPGEFELHAKYAGKEAFCRITTKKAGPNVHDPNVRVLLVREPAGQFLPVGQRQRYAIVVEKNGVQQPVADVEWPDDFENEFVRWEAPVLTAKRAGYQQWFRAEVDGRTVLFHTTTYQPGEFATPPRREDQPVALYILSDQGQSVQFPVGALFDDFRVEAEYDDGFTELVTKKATLRTAQNPPDAPLTPRDGLLVGVRAGATSVHAEFDGVKTEEALAVTVTAEVNIDQIDVEPTPITILSGESYPLTARGYLGGKSIGIINALPGITWQSKDGQIARAGTAMVTGMNLGQTEVTARLGTVNSKPAQVHVVRSIAEALVITPKVLNLRSGQSARVGFDVSVFRGDLDMSNQCQVYPAVPSIVEFDPITRSLIGREPNASSVVTFTLGEKEINLPVNVLPGGPIRGDVVIEPSSGNLAPGQALDMRVFVITPTGERIDRTSAAVFTSSNPNAVSILANYACAAAAGTAQVTASLPGTQRTGVAHVTVNNEQISDLIVEPPQLAMSTGDYCRLRILGRAASGTHPMFPQPDLKVTAAGQNPEAIQIVGGSDVDAVRAGQAAVDINWQNRVRRQVPVTVGDNPLTDLQIEPESAVIRPGQPLVYRVTAIRGGQRRVLGPADGVELFVYDPDVAQLARDELAVRGANPGRTVVMAKIGGLKDEASLHVTPGVAVGGRVVDVYGGGGVDVVQHGYGVGRRFYDDDIWVEGHQGRHGVVIHDYPEGYVIPPAVASGLRFVPEVLRLAPDSPATPVRVVQVLADGSDGRDVTNDPGLEISQPPDTVVVDSTATGPMIRPIGRGETRIGARLGTMTAEPLLVSVGGTVYVGAGRLVLSPNPLTLWSGQTGTFDSVLIDPGGGQPLRSVDYTLSLAPGNGIVEPVDARTIRGVANGTTQVVVTVNDPAGAYNGLSSTALVEVAGADPIEIEPGQISLAIGQAAPQLSVVARGADGVPYQVSATVESMDPKVLTPDPQLPGRFVAQGLGHTQIRAISRGSEAFASVTVSGERFIQVTETLNPGVEDFDVTIQVLASEAEGPLEYRVYAAGQSPVESWEPSELAGEHRQVTLRSPRMRYGPQNQLYNLVIEARSPADGSVQQYPYTFRLKPRIERTD